MSGFRSDMSSLGRIYLAQGLDMSNQQKLHAGKMMRLGPDEFTISKLDNIELREIMGTTRSNINSRI
jgi:hypothetical protein